MTPEQSENRAESGPTSDPRRRFFSEAMLDIGPISLDADQAHHAVRVLRLRVGDAVELFNGIGATGRGLIASASKHEVVVDVTSVHRTAALRPTITLAVAWPKGPRAEDMVNQLAQVGVDRLVPLRTARSVVDPRDAKLERLQRVAIDATRQSQRAWVMTIDEPRDLVVVLAESYDVKLIASPGGRDLPDLAQRLHSAATVLILIGPEGGWTDAELATAAAHTCHPWPLGPHILRIETAALAAAAIARYLCSNVATL